MTSESVRSWIGLRLSDGAQVISFEGEGTHHIVFKIVHHEKSYALKILRTHLGFAIDLPPNELFPELSLDEQYKKRLLTRLSALCGSQLLSKISPLDELWTALAIQQLSCFAREAQSIDMRHFNLLIDSQFVRDKLNDWSMVDVGKSLEEMKTEIVIYENRDRALYADLPEFLARDAKLAIKNLEDQRVEKKEGQESNDLLYNPLLPWMSAIVTGYALPVEAVGLVATALKKCECPRFILQQAGQVANYIKRDSSQSQRTELINFVLAVVTKTSSVTLEDFGKFLKPFDDVQ